MTKLDQIGASFFRVAIMVVVFAALASATWVIYQKQRPDDAIQTFEDCVAAGNPILETYPEQCMANGRTYTRE